MSVIANSKEAMVQARTRMEKAVEDFRKELASVRTGRANVTLLDHIRVDYHGTSMPVNQLGSLSVPEPMSIVISPWDPGAVPLTEDRRKDIVKHLHKVLENHRTAVRNIRRDIKEAVDKLEKEKKMSQDEQKRTLDELEKLTHSETKKIEDLSAVKEKELLEVK